MALQVVGDLGLQAAGLLRPFGQERTQLFDLDEEMLVLNRNAGELDPESLKMIEELRRQALADDGDDDDEEDGDDEVRANPS